MLKNSFFLEVNKIFLLPHISGIFSSHFVSDCDGKLFEMKTRGDIADFGNNCPNPKSIKLLDPDLFPSQGMVSREFYSFINAPNLHMCIHVELSTITSLSFMHLRNLTGSCRGKLRKRHETYQWLDGQFKHSHLLLCCLIWERPVTAAINIM